MHRRLGSRLNALMIGWAGSVVLLLVLLPAWDWSRGAGGAAQAGAVETGLAARPTDPGPLHVMHGDQDREPCRAAPPELDPIPAPSSDPPQTEGEHYRAFMESSRVQDLDAMAGDVLESDRPDCEKVALLRVLYDRRSPGVAAHFERTIRGLPDTSGPQGESVASFAVRYLGERARTDSACREILFRVAFRSGEPRTPPELRRRAATWLASVSTGAELQELSHRLALERDALLMEGALSALRGNPDEPAANGVLLAFGREPIDSLQDPAQEP